MELTPECPFCHATVQAASFKKIGKINCCSTCESFVNAINEPYDWFNPEAILKRKEINNRHPLLERSRLRTIMRNFVRNSNINGDFYLEEHIINALRKLREELYKIFDNEIHSWERYELLNNALNAYDTLCLISNTGRQHLGIDKNSSMDRLVDQDISQHGIMSISGKTFEWIIEYTISNDGFSLIPDTTQQSMFSLLELGNEINLINTLIEQVSGLWHRGHLFIGSSIWKWTLSKEDQKIHDNFNSNWFEDDIKHNFLAFNDQEDNFDPDRYLEELVNIDNRDKPIENSELGFDTEEMMCKINPLHQKIFGHTYSKLLAPLLVIGILPKNKDRDWIFEEEITNFLAERLGYEKGVSRTILDHLCLSKSLINSESYNPFEFKRKYRINRRPLVKTEIGSKTIYYITPMILWRAFLHIQSEYTSGRNPEIIGTDIEKEIRRLNQSYGDYFVRQRVLHVFNNNGLKSDYHLKNLGSINLEKECGEIDVLAFDKSSNQVIVGECKHRVSKQIHVSQIRQEIRQYTDPKDGYVEILKKKTKWVQEHSKEVCYHFGFLSTNTEITSIPIFITNYYSPASEYVKDIEFVQELKLDSWIKNHFPNKA
jgi:hypothetical protein